MNTAGALVERKHQRVCSAVSVRMPVRNIFPSSVCWKKWLRHWKDNKVKEGVNKGNIDR